MEWFRKTQDSLLGDSLAESITSATREAMSSARAAQVHYGTSADQVFTELSDNIYAVALGVFDEFTSLATELGNPQEAVSRSKVIWETEFFCLHMFDRMAAAMLTPARRTEVMEALSDRVIDATVERFLSLSPRQWPAEEVDWLKLALHQNAADQNDWYFRVEERAKRLTPEGQLFFDFGDRLASLVGSSDIALIFPIGASIAAKLTALNLEEATSRFEPFSLNPTTSDPVRQGSGVESAPPIQDPVQLEATTRMVSIMTRAVTKSVDALNAEAEAAKARWLRKRTLLANAASARREALASVDSAVAIASSVRAEGAREAVASVTGQILERAAQFLEQEARDAGFVLVDNVDQERQRYCRRVLTDLGLPTLGY
jgi:hypothetical protein